MKAIHELQYRLDRLPDEVKQRAKIAALLALIALALLWLAFALWPASVPTMPISRSAASLQTRLAQKFAASPQFGSVVLGTNEQGDTVIVSGYVASPDDLSELTKAIAECSTDNGAVVVETTVLAMP